ncbi:MAG: polysaccharide deacetylase family protein [Saprospiraceae bacterium]|nr:polysaccharide deacetylase family protein [Saprospiraceae bacterium]
MILPFYHTVSNRDLPHIKHLYKVKTVEQFKQDLDFLMKHFNPIRLDECWTFDQNLTHRFLLSFDDGLRECLETVVPILLERNLQAMFFVNSAFVDNRNLFYRFKISLLWEELIKTKVQEQKWSQAKQLLKCKNIEDIHRVLFSIKWEEQQLLDQLAKVLDLNFDEFLLSQKPYLSSQQIQKMYELGFIIGGHSHSHPLYSEIDVSERIAQTEKCMDFIKPYKSDKSVFSFPFTDENIGTISLQKIMEIGKLDHCFGSAGLRDEKMAFLHQRIPMESSGLDAKTVLTYQHIKYALLKTMGRNFINREKWN